MTSLVVSGDVDQGWARPLEVTDCEAEGGHCDQPVELDVRVPAINARRLLCRGHAALFMFAAAGTDHSTKVLVRRLCNE